MIPLFPTFKKLEATDKQDFEALVQSYPPYSDYNFTSLWSYDTESDAQISVLNNNLTIIFRDYITNEPFYSFFGTTKVAETAHTLLEASQKAGYMNKLQLIPEVNVQADPTLKQHFNVREDRDNFDYILSSEALGALSGTHFKDKRNLVNRFQKDNPQVAVKELDLDDPTIQQEMLELFDVWQEKRSKDKEEAQHEKKAITRMFHPLVTKNLVGTGLYDGETLIGFLVIEIVHQNYSVYHFMKADPDYKGIFEFLNYNASQGAFKRGATYINYEQDLGLEGLRNAKLHWNPVQFFKKYTIEERS